jgi:uncharacterized membrane protein
MKKLSLSLMILILSVSAYAQLYADVEFEVQDNGEVKITGDTNYAAFQGVTNKLTSKEDGVWFLNITSPVLEEYVYTITLPRYAVINYIKTNNQVRIEEKSGTLSITGTGRDKPLDVKIQYSIDIQQKTESAAYIIVTILVLGIIGGAFYFFKRRHMIKVPQKVLNRDLFTDRQLIILDYLQKHGTVTQAELERELRLPKSSLSRNVETLVKKGVIFKETKGMSNVIGFNKE